MGSTSTGTRFVGSDIHEPNGLAIDWLSHNVYWSDAQFGAIFMVDSNGRNRKQVIGGLHSPRSVAVDPLVHALFWTDFQDGTINFCGIDGNFNPQTTNHPNPTARFLTLYDHGTWPNQLIARD